MNEQNVNLPWSYIVLLAWRDIQAWLYRLDWMVVFGAILIAGTCLILIKLTRGKTTFNFADAFAGENGKTSMSKVSMWIGILTSSWIMVALTVRDKMTESLLGVYIFALVLGKVGTETVGVFRQAQIARTLEAGGTTGDVPSPTTGSASVQAKIDVPLPIVPQPAPIISGRRPLSKRKD